MVTVEAARTVSQFGFREATRCRMLPVEEHVCPPVNVSLLSVHCSTACHGAGAERSPCRVCAGGARSEVKPWQTLTAVVSLGLWLVSVECVTSAPRA